MTSPPLHRLIRISMLYMGWACVGAYVAIVQNRPAGFAGQSSGLTVGQDFAYGLGTALSPTLWWLLFQALFTYWAHERGKRLRLGVTLLTVFGVLEFIGALGEPITREIFGGPSANPLLAIIQGGMIVLPMFMALFGLRARRAL